MGSVASMAKTNLLIIPIGGLIYADKLYLQERSTSNNGFTQPEDTLSKVQNLHTVKGRLSCGPQRIVFMSKRNHKDRFPAEWWDFPLSVKKGNLS